MTYRGTIAYDEPLKVRRSRLKIRRRSAAIAARRRPPRAYRRLKAGKCNYPEYDNQRHREWRAKNLEHARKYQREYMRKYRARKRAEGFLCP